MGQSFTEFQGRGFWTYDSGLELWLCLLADEVQQFESPPDWLCTAGEDWRIQATSGFNGFVSANLSRHLVAQDRIALVLSLAERALSRLSEHGAVLSEHWLNSLGLGGPGSYFTQDVPSENFLRVGEAFIKLLRGVVPQENVL